MCENLDGKFVVPKQPSAGMGWWIGEVTGIGGSARRLNGAEVSLIPVNVLWVEHPEYKCENPLYTSRDFCEFNTPEEAMNHLKSKGAVLSA